MLVKKLIEPCKTLQKQIHLVDLMFFLLHGNQLQKTVYSLGAEVHSTGIVMWPGAWGTGSNNFH